MQMITSQAEEDQQLTVLLNTPFFLPWIPFPGWIT